MNAIAFPYGLPSSRSADRDAHLVHVYYSNYHAECLFDKTRKKLQNLDL